MESIGLHWKALIAIFTFAIFIGIMLLIDYPLFQASLTIIKEYSMSWDTSTFASIMKIYTNVGAITLCVLASMYVLLSGPKMKQIMYLNAVLLGWVLCSFFKNLHSELRPCWDDKDIKVMGSEKDYGNPSGHSTGCGCIVFSALLVYLFDNTDFCLNDAEKECVIKTRTGFVYSLPTKIIISIIGVLAYALVVYSRIYLGAHAINQVTYGVLLSVYSVLTIFYLFRKELISFYKHIFLEFDKAVFLKYVAIFVLIIGFMTAAQVILYVALVFSGVKLDQETLKHIREGGVPTMTEDTPLNSGLVNSGLGSVIIGAHIGLLFSARYFGIDPMRISFEISFLKKLARLLYVLLIAGSLPVLPFVLIPFEPPLEYMWIKTVIPSWTIGFLFYGVGDYLMMKANLLPELAKSEKEIALLEEIKLDK